MDAFLFFLLGFKAIKDKQKIILYSMIGFLIDILNKKASESRQLILVKITYLSIRKNTACYCF
jgi:hypothetical protein